MKRSRFHFLSIFLLLLLTQTLTAQISAPGSAGSGVTNYQSFPEVDNFYVFCVENELTDAGELQVTTQLQGTKTYTWDFYDNGSSSFVNYDIFSNTGSQTSRISGLANGCYRVTITQGTNTEVYRAWVFNNWILPEGFVSDSNCESFLLNGSFTTSNMTYYDLATNAEININNVRQVEWKDEESVIGVVNNRQIFDPPTSNTDYTFRVYDQFGCEASVVVTYESIVTKASFEVDADWTESGQVGEAPLEVIFSNTSENGDSYEWYFYRDLNEIKQESENTQGPIDSFIFLPPATDVNPVYTYENTGIYMVKLVSQHYVNELLTCRDTFYLEDYIYVDSSYIKAPNVFTPNGDGVNDDFIVKFWSMESIKISIFNRWGKRIHFWEKSNINGFYDTYAESVWDGRINGRFASPGVYYYVVDGVGRDGKKRTANGFVHLFRGRD